MKIKQINRLWYVVHTKSRFENVVNDALAKKSFEVFLPKILVKSRRRDRRLMIRTPLFPGYLFLKTDLHHASHIEILKTAGTVRLIGNKEGPISVAAETVESLKIMVSGDNKVLTGTCLKKKDPVMVIYGPFAGVTGTFVQYRGKGRVVVAIEALRQFAAVEVNEDDVERLPKILL
ncbi:MAG TPA: UpxY family transcription antiterminator [Anaerolineae bacterium]|nr:UpxY family transcription antiterminator [Anaerolineae bacterium]